MVSVYEEYVEEQERKEISIKCYVEAKQMWDKAKESFSRLSDGEPCVVSDSRRGHHGFTFTELEEGEIDNLLDGSCGVDESNVDIVILPIQFQEWYYKEPRYSDDYVRYQLGKELEDYELNKIKKG